tara:strand:- start:843 stop:1151 length:309 start_codon:yes stop_codon:yes gene_type:complete
MKYLLLEKLKMAMHEESVAKTSYGARFINNVTIGAARDLYDELSNAEESTDAAQRNLLMKLSDQYYGLYYEDMSYEDCIDYAERQVDKITYRIRTRLNNQLN